MDDLIKRSDAIKALRKLGHEVVVVDKVCSLGVATEFIDVIRTVPSADRATWIPCSERLPKIGEKVLVSTKKTCFVQVFKGIYSDPTRWLWEHNSIKKIDAWMPLPKPFERSRR